MADESKDLDQQITDAAEKLGELVAKHPAIEKYASASKALRADTEAGRLLQQFEQRAMVLARNEQMGQTVTQSERQELEQMQQTIASNIKVKAFSLAQAEMTDVLRKASQAWQQPVAKAQGEDDDAGGAPGGPQGGMGGGSGLVM